MSKEEVKALIEREAETQVTPELLFSQLGLDSLESLDLIVRLDVATDRHFPNESMSRALKVRDLMNFFGDAC